MKKYFLFICFVAIQVKIYPQFMDEPAPITAGNYWTYRDYYRTTAYIYKILDSTATINGNKYNVALIMEPNGPGWDKNYHYLRLDSNNYYLRYNWSLYTDSEAKYYKKGAKLNDSWINTFSGPPDHIAYYKIVDTSTINFYGNLTKLKTLEITDSALIDQLQYWTDEYGLLSVVDFEGGSSQLVGSVKNGKVYGDTTITGIISGKSSNIPITYSLSQNYPNPFNPSTKIDFNIPKTSNVIIIVYNILGKEVAALINKQMKPGSYTIDFNGKNLSSGVYIYMLKTPEFSETKKMILLR